MHVMLDAFRKSTYDEVMEFSEYFSDIIKDTLRDQRINQDEIAQSISAMDKAFQRFLAGE